MLSRKGKLVTLTLSILLLGILKYMLDHGVQELPQILQLIAYASLPVAGGLIVLSSCSLLEPLSDVGDSTTFHLSRQISEGPARNFFIGFLLTAYLGLVRPPLTVGMRFLPYVEWVAIALVVYVMYTMTRPFGKEFYVTSETSGWKRHVQEVERETGRDLMRITSAMKEFVSRGAKEPLLVHLALHLQRRGEPDEDVLKILRPLMHYQENAPRHRIHFWTRPQTKRKHAVRNEKARENFLNTFLKKSIGWNQNEFEESKREL
ncbi:MAG: hypothetical protein JSV85_04075 [Candidatus Bathyarchaeota archaeon]|nr:MAG: hypothetical protein JSV85_04075 [Candidatus Bathyarchaeota archaeon]